MPLSRRFNRPPADFHPEFGYLSPSGRRRSTVRVALAAATFGLVSGVVGATVLLPRAGHDLRIVHAFAAVQNEPSILGVAVTPPSAEPSPAIDGSAGQSLPAAAGSRSKQMAKVNSALPAAQPDKRNPVPVASDAEKPCKEETWPYFDSKCLWGGPRKDATAPTTPAQPVPAAAPAMVEVGAAANTQPERPPPVAKKKPKSTNTAARRRKEEVDPRTAYVNPTGSPYGGPFGGGPWRGGWGGFGW